MGVFWGGPQASAPGRRFSRGEWLNWIRQSRSTVALDSAGKPTGIYPPAAYYMPLIAGELSARSFSGSGGVTAGNAAGGYNISATGLVGQGDLIDAALGLIVSLVATLAGTGNVTAASPIAAGVLAAALQGSGNLDTPLLGALGFLATSLTGSGNLSGAIPYAVGELSADLVLTGELLTASNVGAAVWSTLIESGYSADEILKLISAVLLGQSSGQTTAPVFKGLDGTTDRVEATVDSSGNRTLVTLDPS